MNKILTGFKLNWHQVFGTKSNTNQLYYATSPVPGIYAKHSNGNRYLVAIKRNPVKNSDGLLMPPRKEHNAQTTIGQSPQPLAKIENSVDSHGAKRQKISINTATRSKRTPEEILFGPPNLANKRRPILGPRKSLSFISIIHNQDAYVHGSITGSIQADKIHLDGYTYLLRTILITYSYITKRWMFEAEIRERTVTVALCTSSKYVARTSPTYVICRDGDNLQGEKTLFRLDNGATWIEVKRTLRGLILKRGSKLYYVDKTTSRFREMISGEEVRTGVLDGHIDEVGRQNMLHSSEAGCEAHHLAVLRYLDIPGHRSSQ